MMWRALGPWQVILHLIHMPKRNEDEKKISWFERRFDETLFKGMIIDNEPKVLHRIGMRRLNRILA